jgi:exopolysaccharide biosynthesis polyprenyl glycosylphosphotransferase
MDAVPSTRAVTAARKGDGAKERLRAVPARPFMLRTLRQQRVDARGSRTAKLFVLAADAATITAATALAVWIRFVATGDDIGSVTLAGALAIPVWLVTFARYKLYAAAAVTSVTGELRRLIHAVAAGAVCTTILAILIGIESPRAWVLLLFATALPLVVIERSIVRRFFRRARERGRLRRRVVVIGTNSEAVALVQMLAATPGLGYEVLGLIDCGDGPGAVTPVPLLGDWREATDIVRSLDATGALIASSAVDNPAANRLARELIEIGCHVEITSGLVDISADRLLARPLGRRAVVYIEPVRRLGWRAVAKRMFDFGMATAILVFTAPILLASAVAIKLDSRGPVLFSQVRIGKDGRPFLVRKLRTMTDDAEAQLDLLRESSEVDGPLFKMRDDPRVTRVGRFLRKASIDEIPQMWNVLRGEMSIVGPRPALPGEMAGWTEDLVSRLRVKPGVTGMWQVSGRSTSSFDDYIRHDLYYVDNWTLLSDLAIVVKTVPVVLFQRGAY